MPSTSDTPQLNETGLLVQAGGSSLGVNFLTHPLSTIKSRMMVGDSCLTKSFRPVRGLYNGFWAICGVDAATFATAMITNDFFKSRDSSFYSSIIAGIFSVPCVAIGEGLMVNRQIHLMPYLKIFRRAFRWEGLVTTAFREIPFTMAVFYATPLLENSLTPLFREKTAFNQLALQISSGAITGAFAGFVTTPVDIVKTRVQTMEKPLPIHQIVQEIVSQNGLKGLFRGGSVHASYIALTVAGMNLFAHYLPPVLPHSFHKQSN